MNTAVEYFHSLVEDHFTRDQYEVSYNEGKYNVVLTITHQKNSPMSYYVCLMRQRKMEKCVENDQKKQPHTLWFLSLLLVEKISGGGQCTIFTWTFQSRNTFKCLVIY